MDSLPVRSLFRSSVWLSQLSNLLYIGDLSYSPTPSPEPQPETEIAISSDSTRLEVLAPFPSFFENGPAELPTMKCLMRVRGKWLVGSVPLKLLALTQQTLLSFLARPITSVLLGLG